MTRIFYKNAKFDYEEEDLDINNLNEITSEDAEEILVKTTELFENCGIKTYLAYGTLLGVVRENDFIAGDLDVDLYTFDEDGLFKNLQYFADNHLMLVRAVKGTVYSFRLNGKCYIDIYIIHPIKFSLWSSTCYSLSNCYTPKYYFKEEQLLEFKGKKYRSVKDPIKLLEFWYGSTWNVPVGKFEKGYKYEVASHYYWVKFIRSIKDSVHKLIGDGFYQKMKNLFYSKN